MIFLPQAKRKRKSKGIEKDIPNSIQKKAGGVTLTTEKVDFRTVENIG